MGEFSITHILLVAVIYVMFFGEKKLPELGKSIGATIRSFKQGLNEEIPPAPKAPSTSQMNTQNPKPLPAPQDAILEEAEKEKVLNS